jgi:MinD-like ATPase involved in chromosome partitioning or flagellar assembly
VEVARKLDVPRMMLLMNKVPTSFDYDFLKDQAELVYRCPVALILPHPNEMMTLASNGIFVLQHPEHPMVNNLKQLANRILE